MSEPPHLERTNSGLQVVESLFPMNPGLHISQPDRGSRDAFVDIPRCPESYE